MTRVSKICPACYLRITWIIENVGYLYQILIKLKLANPLARAFDLVFSDCHISIYNTYNIRHIYIKYVCEKYVQLAVGQSLGSSNMNDICIGL